jgi:hypothetical protein
MRYKNIARRFKNRSLMLRIRILYESMYPITSTGCRYGLLKSSTNLSLSLPSNPTARESKHQYKTFPVCKTTACAPTIDSAVLSGGSHVPINNLGSAIASPNFVLDDADRDGHSRGTPRQLDSGVSRRRGTEKQHIRPPCLGDRTADRVDRKGLRHHRLLEVRSGTGWRRSLLPIRSGRL